MNFDKFNKTIFESLVLLKKNLSIAALIILLDVGFLFFYGFVSSYFKENIFNAIAKVTPDLIQKSKGGLSIINYLWQSGVRNELLFNSAGLVFGVYLLYILLQGSSWSLAHKITGKNVSWKKYLTYFLKVNILWLVLLAVYLSIDLYLSIDAKLSGKVGLQVSTMPAYANIIFFFAVIYLAIISYVIPSLNKSFSTAKKTSSLASFLFIVVIYLVLDFIIQNLGILNETIGLIIGFILVLLILVWMRIFIITGVEADTHVA